MNLRSLITLLVILSIGCTPKVIDKALLELPDRSNLHYEPFVIFEQDTLSSIFYQHVGNIEIKDSGFSLHCDYETVTSIAKEKALKMGGNGFIITEHRPPNQWSTCYRIKAKVINIEQPENWESEIIWNKNRKLKISDFKGSTENRPFTAATLSSFKYQIQQTKIRGGTYLAKVETFFSCKTSYFKQTEYNESVLAHEQIHFDIAELYARKFLNRIVFEIKTKTELGTELNRIYEEVWAEMMVKQDEYDSQVYKDRSKQPDWDIWIKTELGKFDSNKTKTLTLQ